ncbi:hypothetical protein D3C85_835450 [compost metagenome]
MQGRQFFRRLGLQARAQHLAQQRVQAIPGFAIVALDLGDEQVVAVEPRQLSEHPRQRVGLTEQSRAQRCTEALADRGTGEQTQVVGRQAHQHLAFEIAGEGVGIAYLYAVEPRYLLGLEVDGKQLQAGNPAIGKFVQHGCVARVDAAQMFTQKAL